MGVNEAAVLDVKAIYNRVRKEQLLLVLEKWLYYEEHRRKGIVFSRSSEKDQKKRLELAVKELRSKLGPQTSSLSLN